MDEQSVVSKEIAAFSPKREASTKAVYEEHWGKRIAGVKKKLSAGENLAHIILNMRPRPHLVHKMQRVSARPMLAILKRHGINAKDPRVAGRLGVVNGRYCVEPNFDPFMEILPFSRQSQTIIELGAGPG